jgi:very-short-patch-repair endonuclease
MIRRYQPVNSRHAATIAAHAAQMRAAPSASEQLLWSRLAGSALGVAFRRQYIVGTFIADFAAPACRLIVEWYGSQCTPR